LEAAEPENEHDPTGYFRGFHHWLYAARLRIRPPVNRTPALACRQRMISF
jgi:hypothetical protein